jgi:hypothetical protein
MIEVISLLFIGGVAGFCVRKIQLQMYNELLSIETRLRALEMKIKGVL